MANAKSLAEWAADPNRRKKLASLLDDPVFQEAVLTLSNTFYEAVPEVVGTNANAAPPNAADLNNLLAMRYCHRGGFFGAFHALRNLSKDTPLRVIRQPLPSLVPEDKPLPKNRKPKR